MYGDFARVTFNALNNRSRVLMQQGRVQLEADWNEQSAIFLHLLRTLAKDRGIPVIDLEREILSRRPEDWFGTLMKRIHLTASECGGSPGAEPTAENLRKSGYQLRGWLTVQKIAEIKRLVLDGS